VINRHMNRQDANLASTPETPVGPNQKICYCSLHPNGLKLSRMTVLRHMKRDRKIGVITTVVEGEMSLDESDAEQPDDANSPDPEQHQSIAHDPIMQIETNYAEFDNVPLDENSTNSQMDWETGAWENNFGVIDEGDGGAAQDEAEDAAREAQMHALAVADENDDHFEEGNTDLEDEVIPQGALFLLIKKYPCSF